MNRLCLLALLCVLPGCALTSKGKALEVRWYTPELVRPGVAPLAPGAPQVRLGFIRSPVQLGEQIAWSDGAYQLGFYEDRRWSERPAEYARSALRRALFITHGLQPAIDPGAAHLEVELANFQEIRSLRAHTGRVTLHVQLSTDRVLLNATITRDEPVKGPLFDDTVAAIGRALDGAANEAAARVQAALAPAMPPPG